MANTKSRERYNIAHLYARTLILHKYKKEYDALVALKYKELGGVPKRLDKDAMLADAMAKLEVANHE